MKSAPPSQQPGTFAQWLAESRNKARYSIRELAAAAGVSHSYIAKIEGHPSAPQEMRPRPSQKVVRRIASVLDADTDHALRLAGWLPASTLPDIERVSNDEREWIARYRNLPPGRQALINQLIDEFAGESVGDE